MLGVVLEALVRERQVFTEITSFGVHVEPGIAVRDLGDVQLTIIVEKVVRLRAS